MTPPRHNLPGTTWLVTRRCSERRFFLRPDGFVAKAILFVLGYAAAFYGVEVNAACVLSDHWHLVITDVRGRKSAFFRFVHSMIGRAVNGFRGRFEAFWASGKTNMVRLITPDDIVEKMIYVMLNPIRANLVERARDWPGLISLPGDIGAEAVETRRPGRFFDPRGPLGAVTRLMFVRPPGFEHMSDDEFRALLQERLEAGEEALREARGDAPVLGADAVLEQDWRSSPKTRAPRFGRVPHIACHDSTLRVQALVDRMRFIEEYRRALKRFAAGAREVLFPFGTLMMRERYRVRCHKLSQGHPAATDGAPTTGAGPPGGPPPSSPTTAKSDDYGDF